MNSEFTKMWREKQVVILVAVFGNKVGVFLFTLLPIHNLIETVVIFLYYPNL